MNIKSINQDSDAKVLISGSSHLVSFHLKLVWHYIFKVFFSNIFIEFLLDLELCSVPLQNSVQFYTVLRIPGRIMCNSARVFAQKHYWLKQLYFLFLNATKDQQGEMSSPSSEYCYAIYLMLRPAEAEAYL